MCRPPKLADHASPAGRRRGLTLLEMLMALSIMAIMAGVMGAMATSVQQSGEYNYGRGAALQHARVALERIHRTVTTATYAPNHPGAVVICTKVGAARFPDTLIVWRPSSGTPANASGPPLVSECVFYCPDPASPNNLVELTAPGDTRTIPFDATTLNTTTWQATIAGIKTATTSQKTLLTSLLRTGSVTSGSTTTLRGAARFECELHPTASEYSSYLGGTLTWNNMAWPQGLYSPSHGIRQVWVRTELQLMPEQQEGQQDTTGQLPLPFFGSSTLYYQMTP